MTVLKAACLLPPLLATTMNAALAAGQAGDDLAWLGTAQRAIQADLHDVGSDPDEDEDGEEDGEEDIDRKRATAEGPNWSHVCVVSLVTEQHAITTPSCVHLLDLAPSTRVLFEAAAARSIARSIRATFTSPNGLIAILLLDEPVREVQPVPIDASSISWMEQGALVQMYTRSAAFGLVVEFVELVDPRECVAIPELGSNMAQSGQICGKPSNTAAQLSCAGQEGSPLLVGTPGGAKLVGLTTASTGCGPDSHLSGAAVLRQVSFLADTLHTALAPGTTVPPHAGSGVTAPPGSSGSPAGQGFQVTQVTNIFAAICGAAVVLGAVIAAVLRRRGRRRAQRQSVHASVLGPGQDHVAKEAVVTSTLDGEGLDVPSRARRSWRTVSTDLWNQKRLSQIV